MKTRIISAIVGLAIFVAVMALSSILPILLVIVFGLISALAIYEILNNTGLVKIKAFLITSMIYGLLTPFFFSSYFYYLVLSALFVLSNIVLSLIYYGKAEIKSIAANIALPIILSFAFSSVYMLASAKETKLLYFVLIFVFAWGADTGAYFAGTFFGKHKLCPEISPKKTIEGAVGGIVSSVVITIIVCLIYTSVLHIEVKWIGMIIASVIFAVVGMMGDLFASIIKRYCGIKDYGNIMPGHGGVLDRFDSVLMIAPYFLIFASLFNLI